MHLELAFSLDTDSFLNCFYRTVSWRGLPKEVVSKYGTNFIRAVCELKELVQNIDQERVQASVVDRGVKWKKFNLPAAPRFCGVFYCMIKAAKKGNLRCFLFE